MKKQADYLQQLLVKKFFENHNALAVKKYLNFYTSRHFTHPPPPPVCILAVCQLEGGGGGGGRGKGT